MTDIQRFGGASIIIGSIIFTCLAIWWTTLLPVHKRALDFSIVVLNPNWVWISSLALPGMILGSISIVTCVKDLQNTRHRTHSTINRHEAG